MLGLGPTLHVSSLLAYDQPSLEVPAPSGGRSLLRQVSSLKAWQRQGSVTDPTGTNTGNNRGWTLWLVSHVSPLIAPDKT